MIIAVINQKGGVGKSTTAQAITAGLHHKGLKTLLIDSDPQGNLTYSVGAKLQTVTLSEVLDRQTDIESAINEIAIGDFIAASSSLATADLSITQTGKEYRLKETLEPIRGKYDCIVIDTPPALGILTVNALTAANGVIIPAQADIFSLQAIGQLSQTIQAVQQYTNPQLKIMGIVLTRHNPRTILSQDIEAMINDTAKKLNTKVYNATIREAVAIKEAQAMQQDIFSYSPRANVTSDYREFLQEVIADMEKK